MICSESVLWSGSRCRSHLRKKLLSHLIPGGYGSSEWIKIMLTHFDDMVRSSVGLLVWTAWISQASASRCLTWFGSSVAA